MYIIAIILISLMILIVLYYIYKYSYNYVYKNIKLTSGDKDIYLFTNDNWNKRILEYRTSDHLPFDDDNNEINQIIISKGHKYWYPYFHQICKSLNCTVFASEVETIPKESYGFQLKENSKTIIQDITELDKTELIILGEFDENYNRKHKYKNVFSDLIKIHTYIKTKSNAKLFIIHFAYNDLSDIAKFSMKTSIDKKIENVIVQLRDYVSKKEEITYCTIYTNKLDTNDYYSIESLPPDEWTIDKLCSVNSISEESQKIVISQQFLQKCPDNYKNYLKFQKTSIYADSLEKYYSTYVKKNNKTMFKQNEACHLGVLLFFNVIYKEMNKIKKTNSQDLKIKDLDTILYKYVDNGKEKEISIIDDILINENGRTVDAIGFKREDSDKYKVDLRIIR